MTNLIIGLIAALVFIALFLAWSLCRVSGDCDRQEEQIEMRRKLGGK